MRLWITIAILGYLFAMARAIGGLPERIVSQILVAALLVSLAYRFASGGATFAGLDMVLLAIETVVLIGIGWVALAANRVWPLFAAALQVIVVSTHVAIAFGPNGLRTVYWGMTTIPTYLQFVALGVGIYAHRRRLLRTPFVPDWRVA